MSVKIRLTRLGRHKDPFYRIVAADSRFARDGRYIEQIGTFDPKLGEEKAVINEELALKWLNKGAAPSDSVKAMLTHKGLLDKFAKSKAKPAKKTAKKEVK
jgi:small subunit ribosomal protein S16